MEEIIHYMYKHSLQNNQTACGLSLGGLLLCDVTTVLHSVTCKKCLLSCDYTLEYISSAGL